MKKREPVNITKKSLFLSAIKDFAKAMLAIYFLSVLLFLIVAVSKRLSLYDLLAMMAVSAAMYLATILFVAMYPLHALICLKRQERLFEAEFNEAMVGKALIKDCYEDSEWFVGRNGCYLYLFHKGYITKIENIHTVKQCRKVTVRTIDGRKMTVSSGIMNYAVFNHMIRWIRKTKRPNGTT